LESSLSSIGYQRKRAKILKEIATFLVTEFQGIVPEKREDLLKIPHVGSYIASAVLSLGFDHAYAMVDTNVIRIYSRIFLSSLPKKRKIDSSKKLQPFAYLKKAIRNSILPYWTLRL
jgi:endonuclease-3